MFLHDLPYEYYKKNNLLWETERERERVMLIAIDICHVHKSIHGINNYILHVHGKINLISVVTRKNMMQWVSLPPKTTHKALMFFFHSLLFNSKATHFFSFLECIQKLISYEFLSVQIASKCFDYCRCFFQLAHFWSREKGFGTKDFFGKKSKDSINQ